jgi:hypothetical protein
VEASSLALLFRRWSEVEAVATLSPLYEILGHTVAEDATLLAMAAEARPGQPPPNILFAAVHALLADSPDEPLREFYATLGGTRAASQAAAALFADFCRRRREELLSLIRTRLTQTNEVRRSALLLPAFAEVAKETGKPLALFEIGPSAGLNLNFDRYHYKYGDFQVGDAASKLTLECEPRGPMPQFAMPEVVWRLGIDINPLDVDDPADVAWLRALIWPEHTDRLALLDAALSIATTNSPPVGMGDVRWALPQAVSRAPTDAAFGVFATFVLNQFPPDVLQRFKQTLLELSRRRTVYLVIIGFAEFVETPPDLDGDVKVILLRLENGAGQWRTLAIANPHGRSMQWLPDEPYQAWTTVPG